MASNCISDDPNAKARGICKSDSDPITASQQRLDAANRAQRRLREGSGKLERGGKARLSGDKWRVGCKLPPTCPLV